MRVYLKAIGCRLNEAEIESWAGEFQRNGHSITTHPQTADIVVFNSCAVTGEAARQVAPANAQTASRKPHGKTGGDRLLRDAGKRACAN